MSKSVNRAYGMFCGCDYPKSKQAYVRFSNKKFRRYIKSDLGFECHDKAIYKKIGGLDWEYRGCRKHSKTKKFKKYKLDLFRFEDGTLNTTGLHKPIKYNEIIKVKDITVKTKEGICKNYPKEIVKFYLDKNIVLEARIELIRLWDLSHLTYENFISSSHAMDYKCGFKEAYHKFIEKHKDKSRELKEELYSYSYVHKITAHECFRVFHRKLQKYYLRKR